MKNIIGVFPTPILVTNYVAPDSVIDYINNTPLNESPEIDTSGYGFQSLNTYLLHEDECSPLAEFIIETATGFAIDIMNYDVDALQITQAWLSVKPPNHGHANHYHANSFISGVFYWEDSPDSLFFYKSSGVHNTNRLDIPKKEHLASDNPFAWENFALNIKKNTLVLFPSYLTHSVSCNSTMKDRKSLSFNMLPVGRIGKTMSLSQIDYKKLK
jgi:uncharacterized protein (TIGR02466 family)